MWIHRYWSRPSHRRNASKEGRRIAKTPETQKRRGFRQDFQHSFLRGLGALAPTLLTIIILVWLFGFIDKHIAKHIGAGVVRSTSWIAAQFNFPAADSAQIRRIQEELGHTGLSPEDHHELVEKSRGEFERLWKQYKRRIADLPPSEVERDPAAADLKRKAQQAYQQLLPLLLQQGRTVSVEEAQLCYWEDWFSGFWWKFVWFAVAVIAVYLAGFFIATYLGRWLWRMLEATMKRLPLVKQIYPYIKQITDFVLSEQKVAFRRVVAVQYPRRGIWSIGFVTGSGLRTVREATGLHLVTVFIPSSPTPVTGYVILVRREDIIDLPIGVDSALRFAISGGVIIPPGEVPPQLDMPVVVDHDPETVTIESEPPPRRLTSTEKKAATRRRPRKNSTKDTDDRT